MDRIDRSNPDEALLARAPVGVASSVLLALVAAAVTSAHRHSPEVTAIALGGFLATTAARAAMLAVRPRVPARTWWLAFAGATLASAAIWGAAIGALVAARGLDRDALFVLLPTAGLAAGMTSSFAARPRALRAYLLLLLAPPIGGVLASPEPATYRLALALNMAVFLAFMLAEVTRRNRELERACANVLTLELHADELDAARLHALDASHAKTRFLANMSHEMRTPLTAILGYAELLEEPELGAAERVAHARTVRRAGTHLLALVNDVLDLAKVESGKLTVEIAPCSPVAILAEVQATLRGPAAEHELTFEVVSDGPLPATIQSDPTRLRQILMNLVGNAIKFTDGGFVSVVARCDEATGAAPRLVVTVSDSGEGIDDALRGQLFTPFTQGESSAQRRGGTGLGLAISRRLAQLLGGEIELVANAHCAPGSTFRLTVPTGPLDGVAPVRDLVPRDDTWKGRSVAAAAIRLAGKVLVADDSPDNQRLLAALLRKAGAEVTIAEDGRAAVEMTLAARDAGAPFGVVLMDMQMPVLDGIAATMELRAAGYDGPIIALTAHAMEEQRLRCIAAGCDDFATKPIDRHRLFDVVRSYLSYPSETRALARLRASSHGALKIARGA